MNNELNTNCINDDKLKEVKKAIDTIRDTIYALDEKDMIMLATEMDKILKKAEDIQNKMREEYRSKYPLLTEFAKEHFGMESICSIDNANPEFIKFVADMNDACSYAHRKQEPDVLARIEKMFSRRQEKGIQ